MTRNLAIVLSLVLAAAPARADELSDLVDKYVAWRGGAAFERLTAVHEKGAVTGGGLKGTFESWVDRDGRMRTDADMGVVKESAAIAGATGWSLTQSGQVESASPQQVETARREALLEFGDALRGKGGAKVVLLGQESREGKSFKVVRVTFGDADVYDVFLDPATGALDGVRVVENRRTRYEKRADWRVVDGVRVPFLRENDTELPGGDVVQKAATVELNGGVPAAVLERPAGVKTALFAGGAKSTGWIPFEFFAGNRIYIPAKVNGHETMVLLDSGAESTILDRAWARKIGVSTQGEVTAVGTGGTDTAGLASGVDIQIGKLTLNDLTVGAIDLTAVAKRIGHDLPVILGKEVFNELIVDIDFAHRRIAFHDPAKFTPPADAVAVPVTLVDDLRSVPVSVEGAPAVPFDFDIGNGSPLIVFQAYAKPLKLLEGRPTSKTLAGAIGGLRQNDVFTVRSITFAGVTFHDVPATVPPPGPSGVDSDRTLGNIGLPVLSRFRLITDYAHDRLYLTPDAQTVGAPFVKDRLGVSLAKADGVFRIEFVAPNSPAAMAGLKAGDSVKAIDRKPPEAWSADELRALRNSAAGVGVELTLGDGTVKRLTARDYF
jgi:hypothetical protein